MKGIIFRLVEGCVSQAHGDDAWDGVLVEAGLDGVYTTLGNYPDQDLVTLIEVGARRLGVPAADLTRWIGHHALQGLAERHPEFFVQHTATIPFLMTLDDVIHAEVRKLDPLSSPPTFGFERCRADELVVRYTSRRRLCVLAEGMIAGAAEHYGETVSVQHLECMLDGAASCTMHCSFAVRAAEVYVDVRRG